MSRFSFFLLRRLTIHETIILKHYYFIYEIRLIEFFHDFHL